MIRARKPTLCALAVTGAIFGCSAEQPARVSNPKNFIYFGLDRSRITEEAFLETPSIVGAQLKYRWPELEPERDRYDLQPILEDLAFLQRHGKALFVQIQDVSFQEDIVNVPIYLRTDPVFSGGVARQYSFTEDDETLPVAEGWVARRWDPAVRARFVKLLQVLARELDGRIEGLNLPETSIGFGESGELHPAGFTNAAYYEGVKAIMTAARAAFVRSHVIQYANFMPGEWLPDNDHGHLRGVYEHADQIAAGVGGPDLLPYRRWQRIHSYALIATRGPTTVAGVAVQWGNLDDIDPATGNQVTVGDLYRFARDSLRLDYLFWGTQEPYYSEEVLPYLRALSAAPSDPSPSQSADVQRILRDERYEWFTTETPNTLIHFPVGSFAQANRDVLPERAEESRAAVLRLLHDSAYANTMELFYVDSRQDMENLTGSPATGFAYYRDDAVVLVFNENWRAFERHELTHVVTLGTWPTPARPAVVEGLATYVDGECGGYENGRVARTMLDMGALIPLESLTGDFRRQNDLVAYLQAASAIEFIMQQRGPEVIRFLWERGLLAAAELLDTSVSDFEVQFERWLSSTYDPVPAAAWDAIRGGGCGIDAEASRRNAHEEDRS